VDAWTLAFSPDSRFLATGSHSGKINIFGVDSKIKIKILNWSLMVLSYP
jgi:WD40 repeat protein